MSSSLLLSESRPYELTYLGPNDTNKVPRQANDSMDFALSARKQARIEVDNRERDAQSTNMNEPFLNSSEHQTKSTRHASEVDSYGHRYSLWTWEILSILFSMLCMAAIVGVLLVYHSRPAPSLPSGLTLNALISLLATFSKAAMLVSVASCISQLKWQWFRHPRKLVDFHILDEASRGPWGSFGLLWATRRPSVVGLGALITIFATGVNPFIQQIITYPARSVETGTSSIGRAQMYDTGFQLEQLQGGVLTGPELGMKAAIYNGIFNGSSSADGAPNCPTGNCTFPLFDSLAFCSKCQNVTDTTFLSEHTSGLSSPPSPGSTIANYTYSLPGNYTVMATAFLGEGETDLLYGPVLISNFGMPESMSRSQLGIPNPISSLAVLQFPQIEAAGYGGDYLNQTPQAWQCALYFCLQTYNTSVLNGVLNVDTVSSWNSDLGTPLPPIDQFPLDYVGTNDTTFERPADSLVKGGNTTFFIPAGTIAAMAAYLNYTMSGSQAMEASETNPQDKWPNDVVQALNSTVDIAGMMAGLASSITIFMRQSDNRGSFPDTAVAGVSLKTETYVYVRWAWIALPATALFLSTIFLLTTMIRASKEQTPVWKSSSLAILFHGLSDDDARIARSSFRGSMSASRVTDMKKVAETTKVRLEKGAPGEWSLAVSDQAKSS